MRAQSLTVSRADSGHPLGEVVRRRFRLAPADVKQLLRAGRVQVDGVACRDAARRLRRGQRVRVQAAAPPDKPSAPRRKAHGPAPVVRFVDNHVVVVDKPAGLTTVRHAHEAEEFGTRGRRFLPPTLAEQLPDLLAGRGTPGHVRAVHRLDKETSGLVAFARTAAAERHLGQQFRAHTVGRTYLAVVRDRPQDRVIESFLVADRGDGRRGSTTKPSDGKRAVTHVRVLEQLGHFALVECRLETGRTHQVRIHLGETGTPLCGERVYDRPPHGRPLPDGSGATRPMLHAATLAFDHPATGKRQTWTAEMPADMKKLIQRLRTSEQS